MTAAGTFSAGFSKPTICASQENILTKPLKKARDKWDLLPSFLQLRGVARQHIHSFDYLINVGLKKILEANDKITSNVEPNWFMKYLRIRVGRPVVTDDLDTSSITPQECRLRNLSYSAPIYVDVKYRDGSETVLRKNVQLGRMPIMLRSSNCYLANKNEKELAQLGECPLDPGGYFIIEGTEKVILIQEQLSNNRIIVQSDAKLGLSASVQSSGERKSKTTVLMRSRKMYLRHNKVSEDLPIIIVLRAMGVQTDQEIVQLVGVEEKFMLGLSPSLEESAQLGIYTETEALYYIGQRVLDRKFDPQRQGRFRGFVADRKPGNEAKKETDPLVIAQKKVEKGRSFLANLVLAHIPVIMYSFRDRCIYLAQMLRRILIAVDKPETVDDRDYYGNKRLELAGGMVSLLFEDLFKRFNTELQRTIDRKFTKMQAGSRSHFTEDSLRSSMPPPFDVTKEFRPDSITSGLEMSIKSGNWSLGRFKMERAGVTEVLSRLSFISSLGAMTKIASQFEKTRKVSGPRALQPSQWGMLCPCDTPEGEQCGLSKNLALTAHVTSDDEPEPLAKLLFDIGVQDTSQLSGIEINKMHIVYLNGIILGVHSQPDVLTHTVRNLRRRGLIGEFISIYQHPDYKAVYVACDGGRVSRPLIVVDVPTGEAMVTPDHVQQVSKGTLTWRDLLDEGLIEYLDVNEENNALIALDEDHVIPGETTHMEIAPCTILGVLAGLIPYPHHNQSPRNTYQCAMGKQAIGAIAYNQHQRADTQLNLLSYPQRPLVETKTMRMIGFERLPGGQNASLAVMSFSGYDIEDAIVLNQGSVDRGYGRCSVIKRVRVDLQRYSNGTSDRIMGITEEQRARVMAAKSISELAPEDRVLFRYRPLNCDDDGIAAPGTIIQKGGMYVNKEIPVSPVPASGERMGQSQAPEYIPKPEIFGEANPFVVDKVLLTSNTSHHFVVKMQMRETRLPELGDKFSSRHGQKGVCGLIAPQEDMPFSDRGICPDLIMNPHGFPSRMTVGKLIEFIAGKAGVHEGRIRNGTAFAGDAVEECAESLVRAGYSYSGKDFFYSGTSGEPLRGYVFAGPIFYQKLKHMVRDKMHGRARGKNVALTRQPTEGKSRGGGLRLGEMERDCLLAHGVSMLIMERLMISSDEYTAYVCSKCGLIGCKDWCQYCSSGENVGHVKLPYACKLLIQELQSMNIAPRLKVREV